jgi:hypothetical protein
MSYDKIYRYRPINTYTINQLDLDEVWGSKPTVFNDPYDFDFSFTLSEIEIVIKDKKIDINKFIKELQIEKIKDNDIYNLAYWSYLNIKTLLKESIGVACFSKNVESTMMWSHYTNLGTGFAIEYKKLDLKIGLDKEYDKRLIDLQKKTLLIHTKPKVDDYGLFSINYSKQKPDITSYIINEIDYFDVLIKTSMESKVSVNELFNPDNYFNSVFGWDDNKFSEFLINIGVNKNIEWSYEDEMRIIMAQANEKSNYFLIMKHKPSAVYLGEYIGFNDEILISRICKRKDIPLFKMLSNPLGNLKLEPHKLDLSEVKL